MTVARVAVLQPVDHAFDYEVPAGLAVVVGQRVWVPWGTRAVEGVVILLDPPDRQAKLKRISRLVDAPPLSPELVALATWVSDYYLAAPGEVMRLCLPAGGGARAKRTLALTDAGKRAAEGLRAALTPVELEELSAGERAVLDELRSHQRPAAAEALEDALPGSGPLVRALVERGLVAATEHVKTRAARARVVLRPGRPVEEGELDRSPKRAEVLAQVAAAGSVALEELTAKVPRAAPHVRTLVDAGLLVEERTEISRDPFVGAVRDERPPPELTPAQTRALAAIEPALTAGEYAPFLLHGVTGSGKTEIYLRVIARARELGRRALVLVPEISLTPQLASRFRGRFGDDVAVLHSGLSDAERADAWRRIQRGQVAIALGARSAVFAPLEPGVVIVDEEHDGSFKQQEGVRYHGRDVALRRARAAGAVAVLGSATPSLETYQAALDGRLRLLELPERATPRPLPEVEIVDLKLHRPGEDGMLSDRLLSALAQTLAAGEQAILFLNRRGFATFILCKACGVAARCRDCSVTLTWHRAADRLVCHYCGFRTPPPRTCVSCGARALERLGVGTEQVEAQVKQKFPAARVARLDRDTAHEMDELLERLRVGELDVVVGTQMITKGHDFPNVTLVGVVLADHGMGMPDFRAAERTFQLLEQVAGRAGRGDRPGRVQIQTYNPRHPSVMCARDHDYKRFVADELLTRRDPPFPPFTRLACVHVDGADPQAVRAIAEVAAQAARRSAAKAPPELHASVLGPAEAPLGRLKGRTRWQLFIKADAPRALRVVARAALAVEHPRAVRLTVDVDPISML